MGVVQRLLRTCCPALILMSGMLHGCRTPGWDDPDAAGVNMPEIRVTPQDRVMVLAPHPDDEVLGGAGMIQTALSIGAPVKVVFLTYGDNNELAFMLDRRRPVLAPAAVRRMGEMRREEALRAGGILGLTPDDMVFLGYPDFGTLRIFERHWGGAAPFRGMLTRARAVCYESAFRPGAPFVGESVLDDLESLLRDFQPTLLLVSHPADFNPDHRALYAFTRVALWNLSGELPSPPRLLPYLVHFKDWPAGRGYLPGTMLYPPPDLRANGTWHSLTLTAGQKRRKRDALRAHASQYRYGAGFLDAFVRQNEIFGDLAAIRLQPGAVGAGASQVLAADVTADEPPPQMSVEDARGFVGIEHCRISDEDHILRFSVDFRRPLSGPAWAELIFCGYRDDVPFAAMPKIRVRVGVTRVEILDRDERLPAGSVDVRRRARSLEFRMPLELAGHPRRALVAARTYTERVPMDWIAWRVLEFD